MPTATAAGPCGNQCIGDLKDSEDLQNCQDWTLEATQKRLKMNETTTKNTYRVVKKMWFEMAGRTRFLDVFI